MKTQDQIQWLYRSGFVETAALFQSNERRRGVIISKDEAENFNKLIPHTKMKNNGLFKGGMR